MFFTNSVFHKTTAKKIIKIILTVFLLVILFSTLSHATLDRSAISDNVNNETIEAQWGGHVKAKGSLSWIDNDSALSSSDTDSCYDGALEFRLKNKVFLGKFGIFETHYEAIFRGGDLYRKEKEMQNLYPVFCPIDCNTVISDSRRLMDLATTIEETDHFALYHRLDRLLFTFMMPQCSIRIGRQAITWGNGFLFNPMDLFNPFAPSDIEREYKIGDDMISLQLSNNSFGNLELVYVPRRNPLTDDIEWNQSSLAGKLHITHHGIEIDIMGAVHYHDTIVGLGCTGYLGNAAWRIDNTLTILGNNGLESSYVSLVANIDYSWEWWGKNFYGYLEYFFNGLCHNNYETTYTNSDIYERVYRGDLFTLGRHYIGGHVNAELNPLLNLSLPLITNLQDPSCSFQPRLAWNITQNTLLTLGSALFYGKKETEYGGFIIDNTGLLITPTNSVFAWLSYYY